MNMHAVVNVLSMSKPAFLLCCTDSKISLITLMVMKTKKLHPVRNNLLENTYVGNITTIYNKNKKSKNNDNNCTNNYYKTRH